MARYLLKRLLELIPILFIVSIIIFLFIHLIPGDPARLIAGLDASPEDIAGAERQLGLDKPIPVQYVNWISGVLTGDLGYSMKTKRPVMDEIAARFMPTVWLSLGSIIWAVLAGIIIGIVSAVWRNKWPDYASIFTAVSGISMPNFWLGLMLIQIFAVQLGWFPTTATDSWNSYVLPCFTLGTGVAAVTARFTRSSFIETLRDDYIRTARAKGLHEGVITLKHASKNAMIPVITMTGLQFGSLLAGSVVVETVFNWPGLGRLLIESIAFRDYTVIQALLLLFSLQFALVNLLVDVLYAVFNPQIRYK